MILSLKEAVILYLDIKGARIPALGFGTYQITGTDCVRTVRQAIEIGYRHLDTAQAYGNEAEVGKALEEAKIDRKEVFLVIKVWRTNLGYADVKRTIAESLHALRTPYADLALIHWPVSTVPMAQTLHAMAELRDEGRVRAIGVSNFTVPLLKEAIQLHGADLLCNQVEYHPFLSQQPVLDWVRRRGMILTAYSPLARYRLFRSRMLERLRCRGLLPTTFGPLAQGNVFRDPILLRIGERHGKSAAQVVLRWLVQQPNVAVVAKAASESNCRSNFAIFDFTLSDAEMNEIGRLAGCGRKIDPPWAPVWDKV